MSSKVADCCVCGKAVYNFDSLVNIGDSTMHKICLPAYQATISLALLNKLTTLNTNIEHLVQTLQPKPKVTKPSTKKAV